MATFTKFQQFVEDLTKGVHNLATGAATIYLTNSEPSAADDAAKADLPAACSGYPANLDDVTPTVTSCEQTSGTVKYILADLTMTASGDVGPFQYVVLFNDTSTSDSLIGYYDYGSSITLHASETLTLDFDGTDGVFSLA